MEWIFEKPVTKLSIKKGKNFSLKPDPGLMKILIVTVLIVLFAENRAFSQAVLGLSAGAGIGKVSHSFTQFGDKQSLSFPGPGMYISGELSWEKLYFDMSLALLFNTGNVKLGETTPDLSGYTSVYALDFNAFGIGYKFPLNDKIEAGSALGFHVSSMYLNPEDQDDVTKLRLGGYYGIIGLDIIPRLRYSFSNSLKITLSVPLGIDFGPMSEDVVVGSIRVGKSPAIVQPSSLEPEFKGVSYGLYLSAGYFFQLSR
jgi:hypothetical protein